MGEQGTSDANRKIVDRDCEQKAYLLIEWTVLMATQFGTWLRIFALYNKVNSVENSVNLCNGYGPTPTVSIKRKMLAKLGLAIRKS